MVPGRVWVLAVCLSELPMGFFQNMQVEASYLPQRSWFMIGWHPCVCLCVCVCVEMHSQETLPSLCRPHSQRPNGKSAICLWILWFKKMFRSQQLSWRGLVWWPSLTFLSFFSAQCNHHHFLQVEEFQTVGMKKWIHFRGALKGCFTVE